MAESLSSSSSPSSPHSSGTSTSGQSKQYIRATANDEALEPDALRGSEQFSKGIENEDDARRKKMEDK